ncbi:MAG TPA: hypothetical protein VIJ20_13530 [Solirubrobacteraceae bacterium]
MRSRRYLLSAVGTTAVIAIGAGAAGAATGSKTTPSRSAAPKAAHSTRRFAPRSGNCPNMGSAKGSAHSSGTAGPPGSPYGSI